MAAIKEIPKRHIQQRNKNSAIKNKSIFDKNQPEKPFSLLSYPSSTGLVQQRDKIAATRNLSLFVMRFY